MNELSEQDFLQLLEENQGIIYKICHIYGRSDAEKDDLFQEISIQLWRAYPKFKGNAKFSTWMYRVALNTSITYLRKTKKQKLEVELKPEITSGIKVSEYNNEIELQLQQMYKAIEGLNAVEKALVFLYLENKPYNEISETLGISSVNARVKMNRIKAKLRKRMKV